MQDETVATPVAKIDDLSLLDNILLVTSEEWFSPEIIEKRLQEIEKPMPLEKIIMWMEQATGFFEIICKEGKYLFKRRIGFISVQQL